MATVGAIIRPFAVRLFQRESIPRWKNSTKKPPVRTREAFGLHDRCGRD